MESINEKKEKYSHDTHTKENSKEKVNYLNNMLPHLFPEN